MTWDNDWDTETDEVMDSRVIRLRYRHQIWRQWLSFEVAPQILFPRDDDDKVARGYSCNLTRSSGAR